MQPRPSHLCHGRVLHSINRLQARWCSPALHRARQQPQANRRKAAVASPDELQELTQKLRAVIRSKDAVAGFPVAAMPLLENINRIVQDDLVPQVNAEGLRGRFREVLNTTNFVDADGTVTLGVLTFNQIGPKDLKVKLLGVELLQGIESPDQYSTEATFEMVGGQLDGIQGVQKTLGRYEVTGEKPGRQDVYFSGVAIFPKHPKDSGQWVATLKKHNPFMDDDGRAEIQFPGGVAHGFRDFCIVEEDFVMSVGNRKSFVCVQPV